MHIAVFLVAGQRSQAARDIHNLLYGIQRHITNIGRFRSNTAVCALTTGRECPVFQSVSFAPRFSKGASSRAVVRDRVGKEAAAVWTMIVDFVATEDVGSTSRCRW